MRPRHMELSLHLIISLEGEGAMPTFRVFGVLAVDGSCIVHVRSELFNQSLPRALTKLCQMDVAFRAITYRYLFQVG